MYVLIFLHFLKIWKKLKYLDKCDGLCGFLVQSFKNSINLMLVKMTY